MGKKQLNVRVEGYVHDQLKELLSHFKTKKKNATNADVIELALYEAYKKHIQGAS